MRRQVWLVSVAASLLAGTPVLGQVDSPVSHFMETGYIFYRIKPEGLVFEAQFAEHIYFLNNRQQAADSVMASSGRRWWRSRSLSLTPLVRLRMLATKSSPVRTPSYMPRFDYWLSWARRRPASDVPVLYMKGPVDMWALRLALGHHSNGQDGCTFEECRVPAVPRPEDINRTSGDFSTHYGLLGLYYKAIQVDAETKSTSMPTKSFHGVGIEIEMHPNVGVPGSISQEIRPLYGATRWRVVYEGRLERYWLRARYEYRMGAATVVWPHSLELEAIREKVLGDWGLFARAYVGQDYYNIGFLDNRSWLQFGFAKGMPRGEVFSLARRQGEP